MTVFIMLLIPLSTIALVNSAIGCEHYISYSNLTDNPILNDIWNLCANEQHMENLYHMITETTLLIQFKNPILAVEDNKHFSWTGINNAPLVKLCLYVIKNNLNIYSHLKYIFKEINIYSELHFMFIGSSQFIHTILESIHNIDSYLNQQ